MNFLLQLLVYAVLTVVSTVLSSNQQRQSQREPGISTSLQWGGDVTPQFALGWCATEGILRYAGTWGQSGETPNAYFSRVVEASCLPIRAFTGWLVDGERVTLADTPTGQLGYAVLERRVGGKDHMWIQPYLGDQTGEDPLMVAKFGTHPDRPYEDMIGRGCAYFVATALVNRQLFTQLPVVKAEMDGIVLDDPEDLDRHRNPIIAAYTLLKGLSYGGEWVWGPQTITDVNFRPANIAAEAAKCETLIEGRKQFQCGMMVRLDEQPLQVVGKLLDACAGRWADLGGVYRFLVGAPGDPVVSITDEDLLATEPQTLEPFPGLESLTNGIDATYLEPEEGWQMTAAPSRYDADYREADGGHQRVASVAYDAVPFPIQVQHLMRLSLEETRRFRKHSQTMPPEFYEYEPLDVVAWTSARNGYVDKDFLITLIEDLGNANQFTGLQEIDSGDYDWSGDFELEAETTPLVIDRPAPQPISGFGLAPYIGVDADGNDRRAGFALSGYAAGLVDVRAVAVQARLAGTTGLILDGEAPYDPEQLLPSAAFAGDPLLPATGYEVRGRLVPFSGRATLWSNQSLVDGETVEGDWLAVTTPNVRLGPLDLDFDEVSAEIRDSLAWVQSAAREAIARIERLGTTLTDQQVLSFNERQSLKHELQVAFDNAEAGYIELVEVAAGPGGAIGSKFEQLYASQGGSTSQVNVVWGALAADDGFAAKYGVGAFVDDEELRGAAFGINVPAVGQTSFWVDAQRFTASYDGVLYALFAPGGAIIDTARIANLTSENIDVEELVASDAFVGNLVVGSANIGTAVVGRLNLESGAVTDLVSASVTSYGPTVGDFDICSIVVTSAGYILNVAGIVAATTGGSTTNRTVQLLVDGVVIEEHSFGSVSGSGAALAHTFTLLLYRPAGTYTIKLRWDGNSNTNDTINSATLVSSGPQV